MSKVFVIAEAGVNHGGIFWSAMDLVDAAKDVGADAVKFQMFSSQKLWGDDRIAHLELPAKAYTALKAHCDEIGIEFMCTAFGVEELQFLLDIGIRRIKIPSGLVKDRELIREASRTPLPVILSTGMCGITDLFPALAILANRNVTLLHCTSAYPCPLEDVNLSAMDKLRETFEYPVGYSDHTDWILASIAAVARGAVVIEKHFTLDRNEKGPDHKSSIEPYQFAEMVAQIRTVETMLGDGHKKVRPSELELREVWRNRVQR